MGFDGSFIGAAGEDARRRRIREELEKREAQEKFEGDPIDSIESWPRGAVAIDGAFAEDGTFKIFEIQGLEAGVKGFKGIPDTRLQKLAEQWWMRNERRYRNPNWFTYVAFDKTEQTSFVETASVTELGETFDALIEGGSVVIKPPNEAEGRRIKIFTPDEATEARAYAEKIKEKFGGFSAQEFVRSRGAEKAQGTPLEGHAAAIRLIVPFTMKGGDIEVMIPKFGYWRVSPYGEKDIDSVRDGKPVTREDAYVVNLARQARPVEMTEREYGLMMPEIKKAILKLAAYGKTTKEYRENILGPLQTEKRRLEKAVQDFPIGIHGFENDATPENQIRFLVRLQNELARISPKLWKSQPMERNFHPRIELVSGSDAALNGQIRLRDRKREDAWYQFSLEEPGSLRRVLEKFVLENGRPVKEVKGLTL